MTNSMLKKDEAEAKYNRTLKLVKVLSRNDKDLQNRLKLGEKAYAIEEWIESAVSFYNRLTNENDFLTRLAKYKITPEILNAEKMQLLILNNFETKPFPKKDKHKKPPASEMKNWTSWTAYYTELKVIAEIALEDQSQS